MKGTAKYTFLAPGVIGKGRGRGQVLRSMFSLGVSGDKVGSFHQSAGLGMPPANKKLPVLEKKHMQTDTPIPQSSDLVMEYIQTVESGSCPTGKAKRVRGRNKLKEVATLEVGQKLNILFYQNRTVGDNNNSFSRHLGKIVRDTNMCPLEVSSWKDIKEEKLNHMSAAVEDKFESDDLDIRRDHIMKWMRELWNKFRGELHAKYVKGKPIQEALRNVPQGVDKKQWEWLVKEHFSNESFKAKSRRNAANRGKLKMLHHIGSKPIREISYQKVQIQELVNSEPSLSTIEIVEKCFGPQSRSHVVGFGGGVKAKDLKGGTSSKTELLSELRATKKENQCLKDRLSTIENQVKELAQLKEIIYAQYPNGWPSTTPIPEE